MKKSAAWIIGILAITGFLVVSFIFLVTGVIISNPGVRSNKNSDSAGLSSSPSVNAPQATALSYEPIEVAGDALFAVRDTGGKVLNFTDFETVKLKDYESGLLTLCEVFSFGKRLGIRHDDRTIVLIGIEHISEYYDDGKMATVTLTDAGKLNGTSAILNIKGKTAAGETAVSGDKINAIKFNAEKLKNSKPAETKMSYFDFLPKDAKLNADVIFNSGTELKFSSVGVMSVRRECAAGWTPCQSIFVYSINDKANLKNGEFDAELKLSDVETMDIKTDGEKNPSIFNKLRNGQTIEAAPLTEKEYKPVTPPMPEAFVGIGEKKFIYIVPFKAVKSVIFKR